jgi:hypothetical protein
MNTKILQEATSDSEQSRIIWEKKILPTEEADYKKNNERTLYKQVRVVTKYLFFI